MDKIVIEAYNRTIAEKDKRIRELETTLQILLDAVDYTSGNCKVSEMIGAVLPKVLIETARKTLSNQ